MGLVSSNDGTAPLIFQVSFAHAVTLVFVTLR